MDDTLIDIGEVARRSGLAASALRFYERKGLIRAEGRNGLRRAYRPETLERLALISCARDAGFTLSEIAEFLAARPSDERLRARMAAKEREVSQRVDQLTRLRDSLRHAVVCTHDPLVECPEFKQAVRRVPQG
ncbi:Transcriptional regulator, MerR family [[Actinomadura] parvosata subsp. kistnae]|uniref:MerR family transcriptional regulator n=1 Tax=[Actinomadura] parvosata subsp. kistnae TaxID=1909395 RepID=A0A1V0AER6_9ACTN|nr:MerR family transcriptional regulator [Nonomuraea sp. ATCC 55076]AQZ68659.1 MerR family transcriptional regulator [Nonomuraea sp. ATCC 55076]SPL92859.1 Transcriptional regulator, MerR family [Actinomadura parvosata subsp. kistnae]